jgi:hypothetical protein
VFAFSEEISTETPCAQSVNVSVRDTQLWNKIIAQYLQDPLWIPRDIYDAGII